MALLVLTYCLTYWNKLSSQVNRELERHMALHCAIKHFAQ